MVDYDQSPQPGVKRSNTSISWILRNPSTATTKFLDYNPPGGVWQAAGTAIAQAPNISIAESPRRTVFDVDSHSVSQDGRMVRRATAPAIWMPGARQRHLSRDETPCEEPLICSDERVSTSEVAWGATTRKFSAAAWKFITTPTGLFITVYGINVVAWGAMLFFLMLNVGPMSKEKKEIWIEIDSQILNALFCLTSWGLAPWRCRDMYWLVMWRFGSGTRSHVSIQRLAARNESWFRMSVSEVDEESDKPLQGTLEVAPPTKTWKMDFVVINLMLNSLFQVGMATFMWQYNRHNRPGFAVGLFMGLGCLSSILAGVMSWWEGRKVTLIERSNVEVEEV